jgi:hypothetical protein
VWEPAAGTGKMPRQSFASKYEEAKEAGKLEPGEYLVLGDRPINHAAMAILETFSHKGKRFKHSILYRAIMAAPEVYRDDRAKKYMKKDDNGDWIGHPLLEALAITPIRMGVETPVDAIFKKADQIAAAENWNENSP